ncbi:MAG: hypothetical protein NTV33_01220 [Coprothermobacterota bacterium]|nr:hypothetical protein [Coprothermobacterota bacterium]
MVEQRDKKLLSRCLRVLFPHSSWFWTIQIFSSLRAIMKDDPFKAGKRHAISSTLIVAGQSSKLSVNTSLPGAGVSLPGAGVSLPGAGVSLPGAVVSLPGAVVSLPGAVVSLPGAGVSLPGAISSLDYCDSEVHDDFDCFLKSAS